jgi:GntR family transcriptional regulator
MRAVDGVTARVERTLRNMITSGELGPGDRLPPERTLAEQLSASRTTIRLVLLKMTAEGIIRPEHGRAYFVKGS